MKKVYCAVFATFVGLVAFSVPAMAQAICGTSAAAGMSMCTSSQGGNCCVPPRGGMANMSTTIRGGKPAFLNNKTYKKMSAANAAIAQTAQVNHAPADMSNGNGGGANPTPSTPSVNKVQGQASANVAPAMASGPIVPSSSVKPASAAKAAPAAAAAAAAAPAASASAAKAAPAAAKSAK